jgi:hypothetical protein
MTDLFFAAVFCIVAIFVGSFTALVLPVWLAIIVGAVSGGTAVAVMLHFDKN